MDLARPGLSPAASPARPSSSSCRPLVPPPVRLAPAGHVKTLATRRGSLRFSVAGASAASVPPRPSVLPPGAGNQEKPEKALKAGKQRAKKIEGGYELGLEVAERHVHAAPVGADDDGDAA